VESFCYVNEVTVIVGSYPTRANFSHIVVISVTLAPSSRKNVTLDDGRSCIFTFLFLFDFPFAPLSQLVSVHVTTGR